YSTHLKDELFWPAMMKASRATHYHILGSSFYAETDPPGRRDPSAVLLTKAGFEPLGDWNGQPFFSSDYGVVVAHGITRVSGVNYQDKEPATHGTCIVDMSAFVE